MATSEENLKTYLKNEFIDLMNNPYFEEWIDSHTGYMSPAAQAIVLPRIRKFIQQE